MKFIILSMLSFSLFAGTANVSVKGMVCAFCVNGVKKSLGKSDAVENVDVNMDKKLVKVDFKESKNLSDKELTEIITGAGFNVDKIERVN